MKEKKIIYLILFIFFIISTVNIYNGKYLSTYYKLFYIKHIIWYLLGFSIIIFFDYIKIDNIFKYSKFIYLFNILLLILVLMVGKRINGARAWLGIGPFTFQPSEFMKISLTLVLSNITFNNDKKIIRLFKLIVYTFIPSVLVFNEPDTGAVIFYLIILFIFLLALKINYKYYLFGGILFITTISTIIYLYFTNVDFIIKIFGSSMFYRFDRIINFKDNYQLQMALIAIYSTSIFRNGFNNIHLYIPEGITDFILAFSIGNFGIFLFFIIIICYMILLIYLLKLIYYSDNKKTNCLIISFSFVLFINILINVGMNLGLCPIIGITLPFLSYGGSSLLINFIFIGLIYSLTHKD